MPAHDPVLVYLEEVLSIHASGAAVKETSFYGPLATLLNAVGAALKPRVRCVINLRNQGAGIPDGGLFTADQLQKLDEAVPLLQIPARGVIEVKGVGEDVARIAASEQVTRYLARYGQVLVTNYREFLLVGRDSQGAPQLRERFTLADSVAAFWLATPSALAAQRGERLAEYLRRALLSNAPLADPRDVAWFLASYARDARSRIEAAALPALDTLRRALEDALGISFGGSEGEHFFRSTLIQTLFYGVFSAWVLWSRENPDPASRFDWRSAAYYLRVPMIEALFAQVAAPNRLRPLGLIEVLDWTGAALNRVDRPAFFERFEDGAAVQYFYEPFLEAFDPELRRQLGVWYTPPEIVRYQVARVDAVLRNELGLADGLADERVRVLDPCCGTGAYLVEVLRRIGETLREQGSDALLGDDLRRAACERVFGFELLPAPFVVAHLQLGLLLQQHGAPLDHEGQRVGVFLTNALTGWEPPDPAKEQVIQLQLDGIPELRQERDLARQVKRDAPILVILGNPPYSGYSGIARIEEERDLSQAYRTTSRAAPPQGQGLNDLYVRFFRMAERRIVEQSGQGVVCFISNYSWLDGLSFTGMRERYLAAFDNIWIDNLHGDRIISEDAPDGRTSETVFAMKGSSVGIKIGTAISTLVKNGTPNSGANVFYRDFDQARADERRRALIESLAITPFESQYTPLVPELGLGLPLKPRTVGADYLAWPLLPELFPTFFPGVKTSRDDVVVDIDRERLERRMHQYFDPAISHTEMRRVAPGAMDSTPLFQAEQVREFLQRRGFLPQNIVRYCYRPFDVRWLYWEPETKLLDGKRADYFSQVHFEKTWLVSQQKPRREWSVPQVIQSIGCLDLMDRGASCFPLYLAAAGQQTLFGDVAQGGPQPNLSERATAYLAAIAAAPDELFYHTLAVLHAPAYRAENAGALRQDWPRVPLPSSHAALAASAALGRHIAALLDSETPLVGVTSGSIRAELRPLGVITRLGGGSLAANELAITARWGYAGQGGVTMPGKGRLRRGGDTDMERHGDTETRSGGDGEIERDAAGLAVFPSSEPEPGYDVFLNDTAYWGNVPERVWEYTIGGYQVLKKWLSYREYTLLGRALTPVEVREFTAIVRRIAALLLLEPALDANYRVVVA